MFDLPSIARWRAAALAASLTLGLGFAGGFALRDLAARAHDRAVADASARAALKTEQAARAVERRDAEASAALGLAAAEGQARIRAFYSQLARSIPDHVTPEADARCAVPAGFVRLYDEAASGLSRAPDPAAQPDDAASGIALSAVAASTAENFGFCREIRGQLMALQDWERTVGR